MSCLVIAELENGTPNRPSLAAISASLELESTIYLLVFNPDKIDEIKKIKNVKKIYSFKNKIDNLVAEDLVNCLKQIAPNYKYIIAPSGTFSKNFIPRLAANLDLQPVTDIIKIHDKNTFDRPIYAGNAIATVRSHDKTIMLTVRGTAFQPFAQDGGSAEVILLPDLLEGNHSKFINGSCQSYCVRLSNMTMIIIRKEII